MHRSRLQSIVIDCDDIDTGTRFWTGALGTEVQGRYEQYVILAGGAGSLRLILQPVPEAKSSKSRIHLDIESDDVEAEVARLEGLGATRQEFIDYWWVMQDPSGNEFCVVPPSPAGLGPDAVSWE